MARVDKAGACVALAGVLLLLLSASAHAVTDADKCEAAKNKIAGKYSFCRQKAVAKAIKTGGTPDYTKCDASYGDKWMGAETKGGGMCPSSGDQAAVQTFITQCTDGMAAGLAGGSPPNCLPPPLQTGQTTAYGTGSDGDLQKGATQSYTDNGDGTITDNTTGLMWEKKESLDGTPNVDPHDADNTYTWCADVSPMDFDCDNGTNDMDGTMVTTFLAALNGGGGFAGHTDWRIPNRNELESILNLQSASPATDSAFNTGCMASCTVTTCSCTQHSFYWSSTTYQGGTGNEAWFVNFFGGFVSSTTKGTFSYVRAVRGGL